MRKKLVLFLICVILSGVFFSPQIISFASDTESTSTEDLAYNIELILDGIDTAELDEFLNSLSPSQKSVFGASSFGERLTKIVSGEMELDYTGFLGYLLEILGINAMAYLPMIFSILAIVLAFSIISSIKGKFSSESVENVVHFSCLSLVVLIALSQVIILIGSVTSAITLMQTQMNIVFPIILTMMAASGAGQSVAVYQPSVAILASGVTELISIVILPFFIVSIVFTIVGNVSDGVKLKKISGFFSSSSKWLLGTVFFLFGAFLSVQGITASVFDGISLRTAKFAISKYVPIIGGYLSDGLNLIMAGSVLVKNAAGLTAVILLFVTIAPLVIQLIVFKLSLSLAAALAEPLGNSKISGLLSELSKNMGVLIAILLGTAFLYFIFLILTISTGNLVL